MHLANKYSLYDYLLALPETLTGEILNGHRFEVVPDWICEILSPSSASKDREVKLPVYARHGVQYVWLLDPRARTLEAFENTSGNWVRSGTFTEKDQVAIEPFSEISIDLMDLWC